MFLRKGMFGLLAFATIMACQIPGDEFRKASPKNYDKGPIGTIAKIRLKKKLASEDHSDRLLFCVFEDGANDYIFVSADYGMWADGEFDLSIDGKKVFTGKIESLLYNGTIIQMGDVIAKPLKSNNGVEVTRITGMFK